MILRGAKVFLVGGVGVLALLIGLDNIFDYETNFAAVRHDRATRPRVRSRCLPHAQGDGPSTPLSVPASRLKEM